MLVQAKMGLNSIPGLPPALLIANGGNDGGATLTLPGSALAGDLLIVQAGVIGVIAGLSGATSTNSTWAPTDSYVNNILVYTLTSTDITNGNVTFSGIGSSGSGTGFGWAIVRGASSAVVVANGDKAVGVTQLDISGFTKNANCIGLLSFGNSRGNSTSTIPSGWTNQVTTKMAAGGFGTIDQAFLANYRGYTNGSTLSWTTVFSGNQAHGVIVELRK